jgi:hypothetical protein
MTFRLRFLLIGLVIVGAFTLPAFAQGIGNGKGRPKAPKTTPAPAPPPAASPASDPAQAPAPLPAPAPVDAAVAAAPLDAVGLSAATAPDVLSAVIAFRQFGSWLDDASAPTRGEGYTTIGVGYWRMAGASQTNLPMLGAGYGVTDRLQIAANVPFYRISYTGGSFSGLDDVYLSAKYTLLDPTLTLSEVGVAFSPVMEVLSAGAPDGRVHFALPLSVELRRAPFRVYGSGGYFTRGAFFTGGAVEWTTASGLVLSGALTQSYSLRESEPLDALAVPRQRVDASVSVAHGIGSRATGYASLGRSLSSIEAGGTSLAVSGGVAVRFAAARQ